jgi:E3 ubiquitin-protein ligase HUWE1
MFTLLSLFNFWQVVDLVPNGSKIPVTESNKAEYIRLLAQHRMTTAIRSQIDVFLEGFHDLVPAELISIFTPTELELLICGLPEVNIEDLRGNTDYQQFRATDDNILWFWEILRDFSQEEKALFLQFVTGTSKVFMNWYFEYLYAYFNVDYLNRYRLVDFPDCKEFVDRSVSQFTDLMLAQLHCQLHTLALTS